MLSGACPTVYRFSSRPSGCGKGSNHQASLEGCGRATVEGARGYRSVPTEEGCLRPCLQAPCSQQLGVT